MAVVRHGVKEQLIMASKSLLAASFELQRLAYQIETGLVVPPSQALHLARQFEGEVDAFCLQIPQLSEKLIGPPEPEVQATQPMD